MTPSPAIFAFFAAYIKEQTGIIYKESNYYMLEGRLRELAKHSGFETVDEMYKKAKLNMSSDMKLFLLDLATNNETLFFRDPNMFKGLESTLVENSAQYNSSTRPLKVWSAACSFGQEVYSLAMLFEKHLKHLPSMGYRILATDISREALAGARAGVYTQLQVQRGLPTRELIKNFVKISEDEMNFDWRVKDFLKKHVTFESKNLLSEDYGVEKFDFIFCRNVLIYQSKEMKEKIINHLFGSLKPGGYLILGTAESLLGMKHPFEMVTGPNHAFFRRPVEEQLLRQVG